MKIILKPLIKWISIVLIVTLLVYGIAYVISLKYIPPKLEDFERAFANKISIESEHTGVKKYTFEHNRFKGTYEISVSPSDNNVEYFQKLSDGTHILLSEAWSYSDRNGMDFPAQYRLLIRYDDGIHSAWIYASCNFPKLSGYNEFLNAIASSLDEL